MNEKNPDRIAIKRRISRKIKVGQVAVGGDAPIAIQSMTNTNTSDVEATSSQVQQLAQAGADIVRVSVPDLDAAEAFREIRQKSNVPLVADIHFDHRIALKVLDYGVDCLRINPGNIGREERIRSVIDAARDKSVPIRIGVNAGSLERDLQHKYHEPCADALVESALRNVAILEKFDYPDFKVSVKASELYMTIAAYRKLAQKIEQPLHLGITEAGSFRNGTVKSALGLGLLLMEGIGDTLRVSLATDPVDEVRVGWDLLKALALRTRGVDIVACPSCSRQNFNVIKVVNQLEQRLDDITETVSLAIIGCYVNGPGESRIADIGVTGSSPHNMIFLDGKTSEKIDNEQLVDKIETLVRAKAKSNKNLIASC